MATVAAASYQRRKKVQTYGKAKKSSPFNAAHFDAFFDEPAPHSETAPSDCATEPSQPKPRPVKKLKAKESQSASDTFDVPSSEDEEQRMIMQKPPSPPKLRARHTLVEDGPARSDILAPWESAASKDDTRMHDDDDDCEGEKGTTYCGTQELEMSGSNKGAATTTPPTGPSASALAPRATTTAARLAARKRAASVLETRMSSKGGSTSDIAPNRSREKTYTAQSRKRRLPAQEQANTMSVDQVVAITHSEDPNEPQADVSESPLLEDLPNEQFVSAIPADDRNEGRAVNDRRRITSPALRRSSSMIKGQSAPAQLANMLEVNAIDGGKYFADQQEGDRDHQTVQHQGCGTAGSLSTNTPRAVKNRSGTLTPKQVQLWDQLLPSDPVPSPGSLAIERLEPLFPQTRSRKTIPSLDKSKSDVGHRTRLVDRLKASAANSEDEESSDGDNDNSQVQSVGRRGGKSPDDVAHVPVSTRMSQEVLPESKESQSQPTQAASQSGPKITYARTRSYLREDNLEAGVLGSMTLNTPQPPRNSTKRAGQGAPATKASAFDLDDSDEEAPQGRLRTIHELRAAGRSKRFAQGTQALLEDIADHDTAARSRRRGALLDLASQLLDQGFAHQCIEQGFDQQLFAELSREGDEIANFILAAAVALILTVGPPEHTIQTLYSTGGLDKLATLVTEHSIVSKFARNRNNNMSRALQVALSDFANKLEGQTSLWGEKLPMAISPRMIGLKAVDLLLGRLKNMGNVALALPEDVLLAILPEQSQVDDYQQQLCISLLEALSASAPSLLWPTDVLSRIATIIGRLDAKSAQSKHTLFLAFRLCLNLTNNSERNSSILGHSLVVSRLLTAASNGFTRLHAPFDEEQQRALNTDLLVLSIGIMINLAEHTAAARTAAIDPHSSSPTLSALIDTFVDGQKAMADSESLEQSTSNVAFGYLAVMLANLCQSREPREFVAAQLPGRGLEVLVQAVEEFVLYHEKVDTMVFEGDEGVGVWGAFTEKLRIVLGELRAVDGG